MLSELAPELSVDVDSAGTHAYHVGEPPDARAQAAALRRGVDLSVIRARRVTAEDFQAYDLVLAMDRSNRAALKELCPPELEHRVQLLLDFLDDPERKDVPDPYYGGSAGFEHVLDLVEDASRSLIETLRERTQA